MDSLIGAVPDTWAEYRLSSLCDVLAGPSTGQIDGAKATTADVPVVTPRDLRHNRVADDCVPSVSHRTAEKLLRYQLRPGDIVCARTGHLGRQALVGDAQRGWLAGSGCLRLRVNEKVSSRYLVYYLGHPAVRDWIVRNAGTAVIPTLGTQLLGSLPVVVPPAAVQEGMADVLTALDDKAVAHEKISLTTVALRDEVLRQMLGGTVDGLPNW